MRHRHALQGLADELHVVALHVAHHQNLSLGEVVEGEVGDGVAKDALLDEQHVAAARLDFLDEADDVVALLLEDAIHLLVVADDDVVLHVGLGRADAELNERDLGVRHLGGPPRRLAAAAVQHDPLDHLRVVDRAAALLHDFDIFEIHHVGSLRVHDLEDAVDGDGREDVGVLRDDFRAQGGGGGLDQRLAVVDVQRDRHVLQDLAGFVAGFAHGVGDHRGVHALAEQVDALGEERAAEHGDGGGPVARHDVLRLGQLHQHLRRRVRHLHLVQDGGAVVGDGHVVVAADEHLVHPARAQGGADGVGQLLGGAHVAHADVMLQLVVGVALTRGGTPGDHGWLCGVCS
mmetsp:Transcript_10330/g.25325  ORF Transcript_10330/g.25325 Transcript_10330/m.25325 type:complete len:346 (-) Transcript_10330:113-1150(-)